MSQKLREQFETAVIGAGIIGGFLGILGNAVYEYGISRDPKIAFRSVKRPSLLGTGQFVRADQVEESLKWAEHTHITDKTIPAFDGIPLHGYFFRQKKNTHQWMMGVHGHGGGAADLFPVAQKFYQKGFQVLLPESRGTGKSGGNALGMGWLDRFDIMKWVYSIVNDDPQAEIVLFGMSVGAAGVLMASSEGLPSNVKCVIADSSYSALHRMIDRQLERRNMPWFPITMAASVITRIRAGYFFEEANAVRQVAQNRIPTLLLHGGKDQEVPVENAYDLFNACAGEKEILILPEAPHAMGMFVAPEMYWEKVWAFLKKQYPRFAEPQGIHQEILTRFGVK